MSVPGRGSRNRKPSSQMICPVCGVTVRSSEIESHFKAEMKKFESCGATKNRKDVVPGEPLACDNEPSSSSGRPKPTRSPSSSTVATSDPSWTTYQQIRANRQTRLKTKSRKRKSIENICPVCNRRTSEDIHVHVEKCLNRTEKRQRTGNGTIAEEEEPVEDSDDDEDSIDIVGEEQQQQTEEIYEEYEWAGQTRIRASSLLPGSGYAGAGIVSNSTANITPSAGGASETDEVNVDGDDTQIFGPSQFSENDVIPPANTAADKYLRSLIASGSEAASSSSRNSNTEAVAHSSINAKDNNYSDESSTEEETPLPNGVQDQVIESLKARLKEYEQQTASARNKNKCQICMDDYKSACVSISCWHVHCEECWMRSLGCRKLCPKCNMITSASDLRRIYL